MADPSLSTILEQYVASGIARLNVGMPAVIKSFDPDTQTASVEPSINFEVTEGTFSALPVISSVPVLFQGGGDYAQTFPVAAGDPCWLVFGDRSLDDWFAGSGSPSTPTDPRTHAFMDCVALVGVRPQGKKLSEFDTSRAVFGNHGPRVACDGSVVHLGVAHNESASQNSIRGTVHMSALNTLLAAISTAVKGIPTGGTVASAAIDTAITAFNTNQHVTPKVKVP